MTVPAVSGPGQLARRTDRGPVQKLQALPDAGYGEQADYQQLQRTAPLAQTPGPTPPPSQASNNSAGPGAGGPALPPLTAPSARPDEPVTTGIASGPGAGPEALALAHPMAADYATGLDALRAISGANAESAYLYQQMSGRGM